jgi:hypothetical protein
MVLAYSGGSAPRTKALDHSKVAPSHKPSLKPSSAPAMPTKRPMVGNDAAFNKKYGSKSWNNGYTN